MPCLWCIFTREDHQRQGMPTEVTKTDEHITSAALVSESKQVKRADSNYQEL